MSLRTWSFHQHSAVPTLVRPILSLKCWSSGDLHGFAFFSTEDPLAPAGTQYRWLCHGQAVWP